VPSWFPRKGEISCSEFKCSFDFFREVNIWGLDYILLRVDGSHAERKHDPTRQRHGTSIWCGSATPNTLAREPTGEKIPGLA